MIQAAAWLQPTEVCLTNHGLECTAVTVSIGVTPAQIITVYKPPLMNANKFLSRLQAAMKSLQQDILTLVLGDMNVDLLESPHHRLVSTMEELGFYQHVKTATTDYGSLLDHVYINRRERVTISVADTYYSNHDMVCISVCLE